MVAAVVIAGCVRAESTPTPTKIPNYPPFRAIVLPSPTQVPTAMATSTTTPLPTLQPTATQIPMSTPTTEASPSPVLISTPIPHTPTLTPSATPVPTVTPSAAPTATYLPAPAMATGTATSTATIEPTATSTPSATPTSTLTPPPTETPTPTATHTPSPTPNPLDQIQFVDNEDCSTGISRALLPTMDLTIEHGDSSYLVTTEIADEGLERQQGLMCRATVPFGSGMLFVFESSYSLNFWMFNTYAPLDIVYLDDSRNVVRAVRMEPCPRPQGVEYNEWRSHCSAASSGYGSGSAARYALELPAGWLASVGLDLDNLEGVEFSW